MQTRGKHFRICKRDRARKNADTSPRDRQSSDFRSSAGILLPGYDSGTNLCPRLCPYQFNSGCVRGLCSLNLAKKQLPRAPSETKSSSVFNQTRIRGGKGGGENQSDETVRKLRLLSRQFFSSVFLADENLLDSTSVQILALIFLK